MLDRPTASLSCRFSGAAKPDLYLMTFPANRPRVLVGLKDMFDMQSRISRITVGKLRFPFLPALSQFPCRNHEVKHSIIRVQPARSPVAASDKGPPASLMHLSAALDRKQQGSGGSVQRRQRGCAMTLPIF